MRASDARSHGHKIPERSIMVSDYVGVNEWLADHADELENKSTEEILDMWRVYGCMKLKLYNIAYSLLGSDTDTPQRARRATGYIVINY